MSCGYDSPNAWSAPISRRCCRYSEPNLDGKSIPSDPSLTYSKQATVVAQQRALEAARHRHHCGFFCALVHFITNPITKPPTGGALVIYLLPAAGE